MFFPYREIDVINHMVIRSQTFEEYTIKYNAMLLRDTGGIEANQFSPYFINDEFAGYGINSQSTKIYSDESLYEMKKKFMRDETLLGSICDFFGWRNQDNDEEEDIQEDDITSLVAKIFADKEVNRDYNGDWMDEEMD